jgi:hypothetical protein
MKSLKPVDRLEIHILVDNATDSLSSVPAHIETPYRRDGPRVSCDPRSEPGKGFAHAVRS